MDVKLLTEYAAIAGPIVAFLSFSLNVYLGWLLRNKTPAASNRQDVRIALRAAVTQFDNSSIFTVTSSDEIWQLGFTSLFDTRAIISESNVIVSTSSNRFVNDEVKHQIAKTLVLVQKVYKFRDSFYIFAAGKEHVSMHDLQKWADKPAAEEALDALKQHVKKAKPFLEDFLKGMK